MYSVYAIYNSNHDKIYIGQTKNLKERLDMHEQQLFVNSYTARYDGDWTLIYSETVLGRKEALAREKQLKSFRGREFVRKHIPR